MKKYIFILFAAVLALAGCENESSLVPSVDPEPGNWALDLDMSNPLVKEFYEEYGVGILTDFDLDRDMLFNISSYWKYLSLKKFDDDRQIRRAFEFLEESFLVYFTDKDFIKNYFPRKILLSSDIFLSDPVANNLCPAAGESDYNVGDGEAAIGAQHSIYNKGAFAFSVKLDLIYAAESIYNAYMKDNLYIFIANLFERNNFYDVFGDDFYLPEMERCYRRPFQGEGIPNTSQSKGIWLEDRPGEDSVTYANKYWLWNKGFVSTYYINPVIYPDIPEIKDTDTDEEKEEKLSLLEHFDEEDYGYEDDGGRIRIRYNKETSGYTFPSKELAVRMMINQMIFVNQTTWDKYPDIIKDRFAILIAQFDQWGIDIRSVNPVMEYAFPRQ